MQCVRRATDEGPLSGCHLIEHGSRCPDIAARIGWLTALLFRSHVGHGSGRGRQIARQGDGGVGIFVWLAELGQPEIENLETTVGRNAQIAWL